jgi:hypothetical protein
VTSEAPWLLFDNESDPLQLENRVNDPGFAKVSAELHARVLDWIRESGDSFAPAARPTGGQVRGGASAKTRIASSS